jgi:hypothetical protein
MFLKGNIFITDQLEVIQSAPSNVQIISMDEDGAIDTIIGLNTIGGTCLLPPIDARIAESDGDEIRYDACYSEYLLAPFQRQFISALIAYLYRGIGDILIYLPDIGETITCSKFIHFMSTLYGIKIGVVGHFDPAQSTCYFDETCIPMWLNMIYEVNVISPYEYLGMYPLDAIIPDYIMNKLNADIRPYGIHNGKELEYFIKVLHNQIHINPKVEPAIEAIL